MTFKQITVRLPKNDVFNIMKAVEEGSFLNMSDFVRASIREKIVGMHNDSH